MIRMCKTEVQLPNANEAPVPDTVAFPEAASLKLRARPVQRLIPCVFATFYAVEVGRSGKRFINMLGVVRPVCSNMQRTV